MELNIENLWVVITSGFMTEPSCSHKIFTTKENAVERMEWLKGHYPDLTYSVGTVSDYIDEIRHC